MFEAKNNEFLTFINQFSNSQNWLNYIFNFEEDKLKFIFPQHTHEMLFTNNKLKESLRSSHLNYSISSVLLGLHPNNPNKNELINKMNNHIIYQYNDNTFTFIDIMNYLDGNRSVLF